MESRNILNHLGQIVGQMNLPIGTSEEVWQARLAPFAVAPQSPSAQEIVVRKICNYKKECEQLIDLFKADNTLQGITLAESAQLFQTVQFVLLALREGALPTAIYMAEQIEPIGFLTLERKNNWIAQMKDKL